MSNIPKCKECMYFDTESKSLFDNHPEFKKCTGGFYGGSFVDPEVRCCPDFSPILNIFHQITQSPEVLAEKLVYDWGHLCHNGDIKIYWKSTILPDAVFYSKAEAIAATVAKLKEVAE